MALLVLVAMTFNDGFYLQFVNYDPQGDDQQLEWSWTRYLYRHTSGLLLGQVLALVVGFQLGRRHGLRAALKIGVPLAVVLPAVGLLVAWLFTPGSRHRDFSLPWGVILAEVAAYPLVTVIGVGLSALLTRYVIGVAVVAGVLWLVMTVAGLMEAGMRASVWLLLLLPPLSASTALGSAALSRDEWDGGAPQGDFGVTASITLLTGLAAWSVVVLLSSFARTAGQPREQARD